MRKHIVPLILLIFVFFSSYSQKKQPGNFTLGNKEFLLNGKPFIIRAAELHYPRIPKQYWEHRIQLSKAMGMNTVCIYLFWNLHEQQPGNYDFKGQNDVAEFVRLVQKNGMYCIVRPGPYVCAEWDMGGLPWWLLKKKDVQVRTLNDPYFMDRTKKFLTQAARQLAPLQIQNGGNIIMVQVENEYASFGSEQGYMEAIRDAVRASGFDKVQLFRCDWSSNFQKYKLDGVATALNFGAGSNIDNQFKSFKELYPNAPLMCSEYWSGWFDHWGRPHETRSVNSFIGSMKDMMDRKISFSLYMAHGGTSFGQWGGANAPPYSAMATSYDYNAPIGEQGNTTEKFFAVRDLLKNYLLPGETLGDIPKPVMPIIEIPKFELKQSAGLFENLPAANRSENILPMENFDQGWGRILYRTTLPSSASQQKLIITEVHDWAAVFIDGKQIGKLDRRRGDNTVELPAFTSDVRLDILVEATGRVNYGKAIIDRKGITDKAELSDGKKSSELKNWLVYNFPVDYKFQSGRKFRTAGLNGPGWRKGNFNLNKIGDTFLDMSTWGKGMVWVNGYNLGRFWKIGPQQTLYIPGAWLKKGKNELVILDLDQPSEASVSGLNTPILDKISPDASLLSRKEGQTLDLSAEEPVFSGYLPAGEGFKDVNFGKTVQGRYFCLEALSSHDPKDDLTTIAELELIGEDGASVSRLKWKVVYADSEETTASNNSADKVFDLQESTFWQSQSVGGKPKHPHQIVLDLGESVKIKGFRYLPRSDKKTAGMIKNYRIFFKPDEFNF
ncbi:beta-galactosidase [Pedobacter sp. P351]|uniref:beta-galactosidase n=1 Tax=Pedobacter superstes TaxID=3133441 RepID=UPI0030992781